MEAIFQKCSEILLICVQQLALFFALNRGYMLIVLLAAVCVLILLKKTEQDKMLLAFLLVFAIIYTFPPTAYVIIKCIGDIVYWRMFWLIPIPVVIGCAVVKGTDLLKDRVLREIMFTAAVLFLACSGMFLFSDENIDRNANVYGVPNNVIEICEALQDDAEEQNLEEYTVAPDRKYASWIRVYDPSIHTLYGRGGNGSVMHDNDPTAMEIFETISGKSPDLTKLKKDLKEEDCEYVVGRPSRLDAEKAEAAGFRVVKQTEKYIILYYDVS